MALYLRLNAALPNAGPASHPSNALPIKAPPITNVGSIPNCMTSKSEVESTVMPIAAPAPAQRIDATSEMRRRCLRRARNRFQVSDSVVVFGEAEGGDATAETLRRCERAWRGRWQRSLIDEQCGCAARWGCCERTNWRLHVAARVAVVLNAGAVLGRARQVIRGAAARGSALIGRMI